jgi:hypothetical protein
MGWTSGKGPRSVDWFAEPQAVPNPEESTQDEVKEECDVRPEASDCGPIFLQLLK